MYNTTSFTKKKNKVYLQVHISIFEEHPVCSYFHMHQTIDHIPNDKTQKRDTHSLFHYYNYSEEEIVERFLKTIKSVHDNNNSTHKLVMNVVCASS